MAHRSTLKSRPKSFKTRHSTKGSIKAANKGRIDKAEGGSGNSKHVMSKLERRNLKNQIRSTKQSQLSERNKIFDGRHGVPRNVAIIPLTKDIDSVEIAQKLSSALSASQEGLGVLNSLKFKQRIRLFAPKFEQFFDMMDAARSADFVLFVLSAGQEITDYGEQIVRCITLQGVTTSLGLIWGLDGLSKSATRVKDKDVRASLTSWFSHFFPEEKLYSVDSESELAIVGRLLCQRTPKGLSWRDERPYIVLEKAEVVGAQGMIVEGAVRGQQLSPDCCMHVHPYGDFRIARIEQLVNTSPENEVPVWEVNEKQQLDIFVPPEDAIELNDEDDEDDEHLEGKGIRIDGHTDITSMIDANTEGDVPQQAKNVPEGTSDYQAAWFLEGEDYRSDVDDDEGVLTDEEGELVDTMDNEMEMNDDAEAEDAVQDDADMEADDDQEAAMAAEAAAAYARKASADEAKEDLEFPDEIELDPRGSGKDRLKRYRGVRSLRHTNWDPYEKDARMPAEFTRLYRPGNLLAARNRAAKLVSEGAPVGAKVRVFLEGSVQPTAADPMLAINSGSALTAFALYPGEEKVGYVNASFAMDSEVADPIKSKQQIIVQYGPRRLLINPLFNHDSYSDNNVHKFNRFLHPGRAAMATFIAPIVLSNAPVVFYRTEPVNEQIVLGSGTVHDSDANRVIVKTAILTGLPVKIHRKLVTIRHMFFSKDDVDWFKEVPLYTKLGAQGYIKESLGTHGLFKATFDKKIRSEDTIAMPLYKRVWPKLASPAPF